ncbi:tRNA lysidine(34) synthetase TilS [Candidatus Nitrospira bockiana]
MSRTTSVVGTHGTADTRPSVTERVTRAVRRRALLTPGEHVLVAVSGGPDSVALLTILGELAASWRLRLTVGHVNHRLRGAESEQDAAFVEQLCRQRDLPFASRSLEGIKQRSLGASLQAMARALRYDALLSMAAEVGADKVALGHTQDDQAETVLMWMLRGAGPAGMAGIPWRRPPLFVRPLLAVSRAELVSELAARGVPYREDSSNRNSRYLRNRVRQELLPFLRRFNPSITAALARQAEVCREEESWLQQILADRMGDAVRSEEDGSVVVDRTGLLAMPLALQRRLIRAAAQRLSSGPAPSFAAVSAVLEQVVQAPSGASAHLRGLLVSREYDTVRFSQAPTPRVGSEEGKPVLPLPVPSRLTWPPTGQRIEVDLVHSMADEAQKGAPMSAWLDADRFTIDLHVRSWKRGDRFQPLGMAHGHKKLQDFFSDLRVPASERRTIPLVVAPEGIVWVGGLRIDHRVRVTAGTKRILRVQLTGAGPGSID